VFSKIKNVVLDILFPKFCVNCKKEGRYLCENCTLFLSEASFICPICGEAEFFGRRHKYCSKKKGLDGLVSLWDYEGVVKSLIYKTKYKSLADIPKEIIDYGFLTIENNQKRFSEFIYLLFDERTVISYVPIHEKKESVRGFDQSEVIAEYLAKKTRKEKASLLTRNVETRSQTKLDKKGRFLNVENAFSFISYQRSVRQVILVDDVWTSGATMKECTKVLKENGVKIVWGLTLSKTP